MAYTVADDVILSVMTLRNAPLVERVQAAGIAGFRAIGWRLDDLLTAKASGLQDGDIEQLFVVSGVRPLEVEFFREWLGRENDPQYQEKEDQLFAWAERLHARHLNVAVFDVLPKSEVAAGFAALCRRAAAHNLIAQLEFMPYTPPAHSLKDAWDIVRASDAPNAGLLIDAWHWARTANVIGALQEIPPAKITCIQLGDVLTEPMPEVTEESRHHRRVPGTGAMDLRQFLDRLLAHGVRAPLSVEVMSDRLDALAPIDAACEVARGTRSVLWSAAYQKPTPGKTEARPVRKTAKRRTTADSPK